MSSPQRDQSPKRAAAASVDATDIDVTEFLKQLDIPAPTDVWIVVRRDYDDQGLAFEGYFTTKEAAKQFRQKIIDQMRLLSDRDDLEKKLKKRYHIVRLPVLNAARFPYDCFF